MATTILLHSTLADAQTITGPAEPVSPNLKGPDAACDAAFLALYARAKDLRQRTLEHNRFAEVHTQRSQAETALCEQAKKSQSPTHMHACLALLDKAEVRAERGNKALMALNKDTASLQASAAAHNKRCPLQQFQVVRQ